MNIIKKYKITVISLLLIVSANTAIASTFTDVPDVNRYSTAINYLTEVGVINGYPNQTFRPDQNVNRVEFLKLVLESSQIPTDINEPTQFPDINEDAWYAKYVKKAKNEGWIEGYEDGTFKPEQNINQVEALKIIGEVQKWELKETIDESPFNDTPKNAWYTKYIVFAKEKNFLDTTRSNYIPSAILSRAKVSELLFRSYITTKSGSDTFSISLINKYPASLFASEPTETTEPIETQNPADPKETKEFTSVNNLSYSTDFFTNVTLKSPFPNTYYLNEVYYFNGTIHNGEYSSTFIFLAPEGVTNDQDFLNYVAEVNNNTFSIPVIFRETGNYKLGLILGDYGESSIVDISVLPELPSTTSKAPANKPVSPKIAYNDQKTTISWNNNNLDLSKVTISQSTKSQSFYFRQDTESFNINYTDFEGFSEEKSYLTIEGAELSSQDPLTFSSTWSDPVQTSFTAGIHHYNEIVDDLITIYSLPETLNTISTIKITAQPHTNIMTEAAVIKPDGLVDNLALSSPTPIKTVNGIDYIPSGSNITFQYTPTKSGAYSVEINDTDGEAIINTPVYVKTGIPLIPNFFDLNANTRPKPNFNLAAARNELLNLINSERIKYNLSSITIDEQLNNLAQTHSADMVARDFFGHINPDGDSPNDRRLELEIPMPVGENLAIAPTVLYTHNGLMQSGIHRSNILDSQWTKVGIGIAVDSVGSLFTTQEFSRNTLSATDLSDIKNDLFNQINLKRTENSLSSFSIGIDIETAANAWSEIMAEQNFFDFNSPNGESLSNVINTYVISKAVQAIILESSDSETLIEEALKSNEILATEWTKVGIGVKVNSIGELKATLLFTTH